MYNNTSSFVYIYIVWIFFQGNYNVIETGNSCPEHYLRNLENEFSLNWSLRIGR